jgi:hypothetical protein
VFVANAFLKLYEQLYDGAYWIFERCKGIIFAHSLSVAKFVVDSSTHLQFF